jgi:nucleoid-associated protein YgaU
MNESEKPDKPDFSDVVSGSSSTSSSAPSASSSSPASPGQAGGGARSYVVEKGDSLSKIAKKFYGDANAWHRIFDANKQRIKNPDLIQPGWKLEIPE